jgi:peptide-methionine (S)-S-oxide reductase
MYEQSEEIVMIKEMYFAGGCLWGVQEYMRHLPGVLVTEAGRANGASASTKGDYDGYAECVYTQFDTRIVTLEQLIDYFFEIIDPYSVNRQGEDVGEKYRTGLYSRHPSDLDDARRHLEQRDDFEHLVVELLPLTNYVKSDQEHQDRLSRYPNDYCHIPQNLLHKYKK